MHKICYSFQHAHCTNMRHVFSCLTSLTCTVLYKTNVVESVRVLPNSHFMGSSKVPGGIHLLLPHSCNTSSNRRICLYNYCPIFHQLCSQIMIKLATVAAMRSYKRVVVLLFCLLKPCKGRISLLSIVSFFPNIATYLPSLTHYA